MELLPLSYGYPDKRPRVGDWARPMAGEYADRVGYVCGDRDGVVVLKLWDQGNQVYRRYPFDLVRVRWMADQIKSR